MAKMWAGLNAGVTDQIADDFNSSIGFDSRMYKQDITGSMAHAKLPKRPRYISRSTKYSMTHTITPILKSQPTPGICIAPCAPKRQDSDARTRGTRL